MKAVIQRVSRAEVVVDGKSVSKIAYGIFTLLGIEKGDAPEVLEKLVSKIVNLRIFEDDQGKMNRSLLDVKGEHLIVSQFTLAGDTSSGRRPSFITAEEPAKAKPLVDQAVEISKKLGVATQAGIFQADMKITLTNDGPVTFII